MSKAVSALSGAEFKGFASVTETGLRGMITVRGDLASKAMTAAIKAATRGCAGATQSGSRRQGQGPVDVSG
jgi:sarcosine oxidase subunit gamma